MKVKKWFGVTVDEWLLSTAALMKFLELGGATLDEVYQSEIAIEKLLEASESLQAVVKSPANDAAVQMLLYRYRDRMRRELKERSHAILSWDTAVSPFSGLVSRKRLVREYHKSEEHYEAVLQQLRDYVGV